MKTIPRNFVYRMVKRTSMNVNYLQQCHFQQEYYAYGKLCVNGLVYMLEKKMLGPKVYKKNQDVENKE